MCGWNDSFNMTKKNAKNTLISANVGRGLSAENYSPFVIKHFTLTAKQIMIISVFTATSYTRN